MAQQWCPGGNCLYPPAPPHFDIIFRSKCQLQYSRFWSTYELISVLASPEHINNHIVVKTIENCPSLHSKNYIWPRFHGPWPQCCAHFVFMCAPLISRDGQQQSRGVNSCIRVLIIAVMRSLLARIPLPSSLKSTETTKKRASVRILLPSPLHFA